MSETLQYTKFCEGLKSFITRKRKENSKQKVKLIVTDGIKETITYEKVIPEFGIINDELLNPEIITFEIQIDNQPVKKGFIKEAKKEISIQGNNPSYPTPPAMESNMMQFMFSMMQQSNNLLAESQKANMLAIIDATTKNADAREARNQDSMKALLEIHDAKSKASLEIEREKFKFELEKRETLEAIGKDSTTLSDLLNKATGLLEKVPMPIWGGLYKIITKQEMPGFIIPTSEEDAEIKTIVDEAMK